MQVPEGREISEREHLCSFCGVALVNAFRITLLACSSSPGRIGRTLAFAKIHSELPCSGACRKTINLLYRITFT